VRVQLVRAWRDRFEAEELELPEGATVAQALERTRLPLQGVAGTAIHGERAGPETRLEAGDRLELLEPLLADPKDSRRRRAQVQAARRGN
jgi:putative ubiquitin-RnfH superfamily antitoxin RatB of RatAB toxin-antitoxin module